MYLNYLLGVKFFVSYFIYNLNHFKKKNSTSNFESFLSLG